MRFCIGTASEFNELLDYEEWLTVHRIAEKQGLVGGLFDRIGRVDKKHESNEELLFKWIGEAQTIRIRTPGDIDIRIEEGME